LRETMINFDVTIAKSAVEGKGVFASSVIPRRAKIGEVTGIIISTRQARTRARGKCRICLIDISDTQALDCTQGNLFRHLNHSCQSNAFLRIFRSRVEVYARKSIPAGEEITVDYGETPHGGGMKCRCGQSGCRDVI